ncbi:TonB-dependent receptor domain-containing protein [Marinobacter halophilus]|uniref:TonB-dependent receptor n=1 Tax=Marinobacter halophilus TaxID=1323740 RepID=A0A2T1KJ79_9GAMM|nr:TonB-dependent receptor [Marinobacter halophilus]PSF10169.1 TonB-dependent receptor [Marinobacter halophilus]GGC68329.1 TonB-dependent receptor [Marinobacter halophilus]
MTYSKALPALILLPLAFPAGAADKQAEDRRLEPLVVTATLGPRTAGESLSSVTVIDEETIRQQSPSEFSQLLRGQAGINVVGNGSFGKATSVFTRGTANDSTLLLVDGVRLRSATSGGPSWQYFPVELIDRVEIVRGARSSLYGADAVGGVVQAFTLDPEETPAGWVEVGAGNFNTQKSSAGVAASSGNTRFSLSGLHKETDGTAIITDGKDRGFRNTAGIGRVVHELESGGEASLVVVQSEGSTEYEGGDIDFMIRTIGFGLETPVSEYWRHSLQFSESRDETDNVTPTFSSTFNTRSRAARWDNTFTWNVHELVVGTELMTDEVSGTTDYVESSRTNSALYSQLRLNFGPTDVQLSLRGDDNEAYGKNETGGIALGHALDRSHRVRVSYGTAFRAPTFNDLYYPGANPDLEAEESGTVELGASGHYQSWFWDGALFQLDVDNLIAWSPTPSGLWTPMNVNEARIRGAELSAGFEWDGWRGDAALTLLDTEDRETENRLQRRSGKTLRLDLSKHVGTWDFGGTVVAEDYRYDDRNNNDRLPGFATLDLRAGWRFASDWSTRLTLANVLDKEYSTARYSSQNDLDYIAAGRTVMLTVRYDIR